MNEKLATQTDEDEIDLRHYWHIWLTKKVDSLHNHLKESEKALQAYMEKEKIVKVAGIKSVAIRQIEEIASDLVEARRQQAIAEKCV
jgi:uncharacterized protein involved in exopolysaccharide biosynthesis